MHRKASVKRKISSVSVTLGLVCILLCAFFITHSDSQFTAVDTNQDFVKVLDVGQGDCTLIYSNGYCALIDTGTADAASDVCIELQKYNISKIDVVLITHLHDDHSGGAERISEIFEIGNVILPEISTQSEGLYSAELLINCVTESGGGVYNAEQGMNFKIGEFEVTVLAAYNDMKDENNRSVITVAEIDGLKFIFSGDAEAEVEEKLLSEGLDLKCDFFKAAHHGSSTSNTKELLAKMRPRYTAISCGRDNMYGHPNNEVLANFEYYSTEIYRTDYDGDITFSIENGRISVDTEKQ